MEIGLFLCSVASASPQEHALKLQQHARCTAQTTPPTVVPGFTTATPPAVAFNDPHGLEAATANVFRTNATADTLRRSAETRPYFRMDLEKDPLIENAERAVQDPEAVLQGPLENRDPQAFQRVTCRESKPETTLKCSKTLLPPEFDVTPAKYSHYWCTSGAHRPDNPACQAKAYFNPARIYEPEKVRVTKEFWTSSCQTLEERERRGLCRLVKKECPGGPETRDVVGRMGDKAVTRPITRDCWRYELTYNTCTHPSANTCDGLRQAGCEQINSRCIQQVGEACVEWEQTLRCPRSGQPAKKTLTTSPYTLPVPGKDAAEQTANTDMADAIAKLQALKEVQDELRAEGQATSLPLIFKGRSCACTIAFAGFKDCCTDGKGWGVSLGVSGCNGEDKDLADRQQKGLCHEVGTYCAEKVLGVCIRKKRRYCCFPSKLSRIIHVQGRPQVGISWGSPEEPQCRGFTTEELSRLHFDQFDLREVYTDVTARLNQRTSDVVHRNLSERMGQMTHTFKPKADGGGM